jgi:MFS family permease
VSLHAQVYANDSAPSAFGLIAANIHGKDRATAFAMFSAGAPLGAGTGIVLGGVFTAYTEPTWRAVLWFFSGLGFFAALLAVLFVPKDSPHPHDRRLDLVGAAMITTGLVLFQFTISFAGTKGWKTPCTYAWWITLMPDIAALFPVSVILIVAFFFWEYHVIHHTSRPPLVSLALFTRAKGRLASMYFVGFIAMAGFVSIGFNATLFYQVRDKSS